MTQVIAPRSAFAIATLRLVVEAIMSWPGSGRREENAMGMRTLVASAFLAAVWPVAALGQAATETTKEQAQVSQQVKDELAPAGVLRAGINLSNFLLVTGKADNGDPVGVSPDMAREVAQRLGVAVKYVTFKTPGELADAAETGAWDIGLIGAEPQRAEKIAFTAAYVEIEATYLVPAGSPLKAIADVDRAGVRIAVTGRSAYGLWLDRNIKQAQLVRSDTLDSALEQFMRDKLDALAGLRPRLLSDVTKLPGARILDGQFTAVQQAIGTARKNAAGAAFLRGFVEEAKASGFVARLIERHKVRGLSVAPPA
jgi:polar amino acid transport system substrate-binding protein